MHYPLLDKISLSTYLVFPIGDMTISIPFQLFLQFSHMIFFSLFLFYLKLRSPLEHPCLLVICTLVDNVIFKHIFLVMLLAKLIIEEMIGLKILLMFIPYSLQLSQSLPLNFVPFLQFHLGNLHIHQLTGLLLLLPNGFKLLRIAYKLLLLPFLLLHLLITKLVIVIIGHKSILFLRLLDRVHGHILIHLAHGVYLLFPSALHFSVSLLFGLRISVR